jgi:uncharacterized protein YuzE
MKPPKIARQALKLPTYINLSEGKSYRNELIGDQIIVDYSKSGKIVGVEILPWPSIKPFSLLKRSETIATDRTSEDFSQEY